MNHYNSIVASEVSTVNPQQHLSLPSLFTIKQFSERHPAFSQGSLRALIFNSRNRKSSEGEIPGNGLEKSLIRIGRKICINEASFFAWVGRQGS